MTGRDPLADLRRIAFLLERANEASFRVKAFRSAAKTLAELPAPELAARAEAGTLTELSGVGDVTARTVTESLRGEEPVYLRRLLATEGLDLDEEAAALRAALRGDCHTHSDWSDGGSPIEEMALAAVELGHEYLVLTDHSPRLTVARGLTAARLRRQLDYVAAVNDALPEGFRILTGIEVDILDDGSLDQDEELLARLDVVVGSVHSNLRDPKARMTRRMLAAVANPHLDILGHCTGRMVAARPPGVTGPGDRGHRARTRPPSDFDADAVFAACAEHDKAVEINSRPERQDPPKRLIRVAVEAGCRFAIDTDAHAPGQLDWQRFGCERAARCGVPVERVVNTWSAEALLDWTGSHAA
ncbi:MULTISPECIES: PHP domain-containing protein [unclassified Plantactinospora]|uniref:PHP domain-containing protein n=1 Tax=unclassified Plantactinospora TaxID=2631981 RepID=UPI000D175002|nr:MULTISPECIES: PHP domain-containing protein [unclassified Plantactinospora]AVT33929.1 PHP domain-containing protein [Plantactinospora sp. BC1]AVT36191.1 PHP domain-containing protein [Plantactinospora sp. BB1]